MNGVKLDFSRPGKPTDNCFVESFNGKFREECLNASWLLTLEEAQAKCEAWRREYNEVRPHSSIGYQTPAELIFPPGQACLARGNKADFSHKKWSKVRGKLNAMPRRLHSLINSSKHTMFNQEW